MYAIHSISPVSSARRGAPVCRTSRTSSAVRTTRTVQTTGSVQPAPVLSSAQNTAPAANTDLPLGLLQSVSQPSSSNSQATLDYTDLRTALDSGNLTAAQQAYLRLQTDLYMPQMSAMA